jgi:hypothetical protein
MVSNDERSFFMSIPILGKAAKLTGDRNTATWRLGTGRHAETRFASRRPLPPFADFRKPHGTRQCVSVLGLVLTLSECPADHPEFKRIPASSRTWCRARAVSGSGRPVA